MEELPQSWCTVPLADLVKINPGIDKTQFRDNDEMPFVPMPAVEAETGRINTSERRPFGRVKSGFTAFASGDVLFAKITPCMENGKMAVVPALPRGIGFGTTEFHVLRPTEAVDAQFVYYFVSSAALRHEAQHQMTGAVGQKRVPKRYLETKPFPLPPINEQRRIVEKIETLFARLDKGEEALREVQKLLARYRQSVLKAAVTGQLTADWRAENAPRLEHGRDLLARILRTRRESWEGRGKYKEPAAPDTADLPELPEGWVWTSLESLSSNEPHSIVDGPFGSKLKTEHYQPSGVRVIRLENIGDGQFIDKASHVSEAHAHELVRHSILAGDLVIASLGQELPRACRIPDTIERAIVKADCIRFSPHKNFVSPQFVLSWLNSRVLRDKVSAAIRGVGRPRLNLRDIRTFAVPLPSLEEQREIASRVREMESKMKSLETWCSAELDRSAALRQSILKDAFAGRLVPQDPSDEPAADLLARIKESRTSTPRKARRTAPTEATA